MRIFGPCQCPITFTAHTSTSLSEECFKCASFNVCIGFVFSLKPISFYSMVPSGSAVSSVPPSGHPAAPTSRAAGCVPAPATQTGGQTQPGCGSVERELAYCVIATWFVNTIKVSKCLPVFLFLFLLPFYSRHGISCVCQFLVKEMACLLLLYYFVLLFIGEQNVRSFCLVDNFFTVTMLLSLVM